MSYLPSDVKPDWAVGRVLACDLAWRSDHTALVGCGVYAHAGMLIIQAEIVRREPAGQSPAATMATLREVWHEFADNLRPCHLVVDAANNMPIFHGLVASGWAGPPQGVLITRAQAHARSPEPITVPLPNGLRRGAALWHLSRNRLIEDLDAAGEQGLVVVAPGARDADLLKAEMGSLLREVSDAGNVGYVTPPGSHDDLVIALALAYWAVPRLRLARRGHHAFQQPPPPRAWT